MPINELGADNVRSPEAISFARSLLAMQTDTEGNENRAEFSW